MLGGRFFTTEPPGKPLFYKLNHRNCTSLLFFGKTVPCWQYPYSSPKTPASPASVSLVKPSCVFLSLVKLGASFSPLMAAKMHGLIHWAWPFPCPGVLAQLLFADSPGCKGFAGVLGTVGWDIPGLYSLDASLLHSPLWQPERLQTCPRSRSSPMAQESLFSCQRGWVCHQRRSTPALKLTKQKAQPEGPAQGPQSPAPPQDARGFRELSCDSFDALSIGTLMERPLSLRACYGRFWRLGLRRPWTFQRDALR